MTKTTKAWGFKNKRTGKILALADPTKDEAKQTCENYYGVLGQTIDFKRYDLVRIEIREVKV